MWCNRLPQSKASATSVMSAEEAFETGRAAWDGRRALSDLAGHVRDFDQMIDLVPGHLHLAALSGWLNAFEDEAARLEAGRL